MQTDAPAGENVPRLDPPERPYTVVSDGDCKVCKRFVTIIAKWDTRGEIEFLQSQTQGVAARYPWIPAEAYVESIQLIENSSRKTWQGAAALEHIIDVLPKGQLITWIFSIPFARPLAERFYRWFAMNRYRLGCGEHCRADRPDL